MLSYIGGKSKIATFIRNYVPVDTETYVETFSGMFWLFFKLDNLKDFKNLKRVVYNDVNPLNTNLFLAVKNYNKLYELSEGIPMEDEETFNQFKSEIFDPNLKLDVNVPNYEIAYKYAYILNTIWSGKNPRKGKMVKNGGGFRKSINRYVSKFEAWRTKLIDPKWQKLFDKITDIERLDFEDVIKKYDSEKTYFYCDPPYYNTEDYYDNHNFGHESHLRLANSLKNIKGKFGLSYYYFDELDEFYPKNEFFYNEKEVKKFGGNQKGQKANSAIELLINNYK